RRPPHQRPSRRCRPRGHPPRRPRPPPDLTRPRLAAPPRSGEPPSQPPTRGRSVPDSGTGSPQNVGGPASDRPAKAPCRLGAAADDIPVGDVDHDEARSREVGVADLVPLPVGPVEYVRRPSVALDDDRGTGDEEVDDVPTDRDVE